MEGLSSRDLSKVLEFIDLAWSASGDEPFPLVTLEALQRLIPCDAATYSALDRQQRRSLQMVSTDGYVGDDDFFFSRVQPEHPLCRHHQAYFDFSAIRLSDVVSTRRLKASRIYAEWFRPLDIGAELEVGIARSRVRTRNFLLDRDSGDFSTRDCRILDLLAPHLARIYETTELRRACAAASPGQSPLSPREAEVLELVAQGLTNAAVAERLWIAPGTVKKHLENIYEKLGVANRAAAVAAIAELA